MLANNVHGAVARRVLPHQLGAEGDVDVVVLLGRDRSRVDDLRIDATRHDGQEILNIARLKGAEGPMQQFPDLSGVCVIGLLASCIESLDGLSNICWRVLYGHAFCSGSARAPRTVERGGSQTGIMGLR